MGSTFSARPGRFPASLSEVGRYVDLFDDRVRILFSGLHSLAVLRGEISIPYSAIEEVGVGLDEVPSPWAFRVGVSNPLTDRRQGRFWAGRITRSLDLNIDERLFLDITERTRAVVLRLKPGSEFDVVAFDDSRPDELAAEIRKRVPAS